MDGHQHLLDLVFFKLEVGELKERLGLTPSAGLAGIPRLMAEAQNERTYSSRVGVDVAASGLRGPAECAGMSVLKT